MCAYIKYFPKEQQYEWGCSKRLMGVGKVGLLILYNVGICEIHTALFSICICTYIRVFLEFHVFGTPKPFLGCTIVNSIIHIFL